MGRAAWAERHGQSGMRRAACAEQRSKRTRRGPRQCAERRRGEAARAAQAGRGSARSAGGERQRAHVVHLLTRTHGEDRRRYARPVGDPIDRHLCGRAPARGGGGGGRVGDLVVALVPVAQHCLRAATTSTPGVTATRQRQWQRQRRGQHRLRATTLGRYESTPTVARCSSRPESLWSFSIASMPSLTDRWLYLPDSRPCQPHAAAPLARGRQVHSTQRPHPCCDTATTATIASTAVYT